MEMLPLAQLVPFDFQPNDTMDAMAKSLITLARVTRKTTHALRRSKEILEDVAVFINEVDAADQEKPIGLRDKVDYVYDDASEVLKNSKSHLGRHASLMGKIVWTRKMTTRLDDMLCWFDELFDAYDGAGYMAMLEEQFDEMGYTGLGVDWLGGGHRSLGLWVLLIGEVIWEVIGRSVLAS